MKTIKLILRLSLIFLKTLFSFDFEDYEHSTETEIRWGMIGQTAQYGLIFLTYTIAENNDVRFISARKAEKWMVKKYEENRRRL